MADTAGLWAMLLQFAEPLSAAALKQSAETAPDKALVRVNALAFAKAVGLDEDATVGTFARAAQLGLFDMTWRDICPGCGGVLETVAAPKMFISASN